MKISLKIDGAVLLIALLTILPLIGPACSRLASRNGESVGQKSTAKRAGGPGGSFESVTGRGYFDVPAITMPPKGKSFKDPNFHTTITRITDKKKDRYVDPGIENEYAKADPENCDGTLLILRGNTAAWYLYDLKTYKKLRQLKVFDNCGQEPEPRWDPSNPKLFYYLCNMELKSYDVDTKASVTIHDFKKDVRSGEYLTTGSEGDASLDRRYWSFIVKDEDWKLKAVLVYDKESDEVIGRKSSGFPDTINWVGMDMSGNHCVVGYDELLYPHIFSKDLKTKIALPKGSSGHGDLARTVDGKDVLVYQNVATDFIAMSDLDTGKETPLVKIPFIVNADIGLHFSGNCDKAPGWVLVSTYGSKNLPPDKKKHSWMDTQLFMVELKQNPAIWRIAHTHSFTSVEYSGEKNYFAEAFAAINTDGTRIYFGSNWGRVVTDYTEVYQVKLPDNWAGHMPK